MSSSGAGFELDNLPQKCFVAHTPFNFILTRYPVCSHGGVFKSVEISDILCCSAEETLPLGVNEAEGTSFSDTVVEGFPPSLDKEPGIVCCTAVLGGTSSPSRDKADTLRSDAGMGALLHWALTVVMQGLEVSLRQQHLHLILHR